MKYLGKSEDGQEIWGYDFQDVAVKAVGENEIEIIGSTEDLDRDQEIIKMDGWDLRNFKKNPVILPSHMYWEPAIGRGKVSKKDGKLVFKIEFPPEGDYPLADIYRKLYKNDFMRACSVGFMIKEAEWGENPGDPRRTIIKQELLELSLCSVPCNPSALTTAKELQSAVKKGVINSRDVKTLEEFVKDCFQEKPEDKKFFSIPGGDSDDGTKKPQGDTTPIDDKGEEPEGKETEEPIVKVKDGIVLIKQGEEYVELSSFLQGFKSEIVTEVCENIKKDNHYINKLLSDPAPEGATETMKGLTDSIKAAFKK
ncbi:hypothetical protein DRJ16_06535 [Candidatus Woesearchaeota archaeon]|nr:MAG: hypothetical protein DRJ16_06535 [Candidatus Woesearchaeota archaeon]